MSKLTVEEIFKEQLRILESCGHSDEKGIAMSRKYFAELLVRPAFGDSDEKYEKVFDVFDLIESKESEA